MFSPHAPGSVPPPPPPPPDPAGGTEDAVRSVPSHDDIPTAPFTPVPAAPQAMAMLHAPVPPGVSSTAPVRRFSVLPGVTDSSADSLPAPAPVQRVSAAQRLPRTTAPSSAYAAAAPQPAPPMPGAGIPRQQAPADEPGGDWFGEAAAQQARPASYAPPPPAVAPAYTPATVYPSEAAPVVAGQARAAQPAAVPPPTASTGAVRRRLSPGMIAFIVVDVVLLIAAAVFAWNMLTGPAPVDQADGATTPTSQGTQASPEASEAPATAQPLAQFASPSLNITCAITTADVTCSIAQLNQQPAPVEGCEGTVGYQVTIDAATGEVQLPCVPADQQPQRAPDSLPKVEYGQSVTEGQFTCISEDTGMSCKDDKTGKGFTIAKAGIGTF